MCVRYVYLYDVCTFVCVAEAGGILEHLRTAVPCDSTCVCMQVVRIQLTDPSNGANIGVSSVAEISIPANDDPYGVVEFSADRITIGEIDTNVSVFRR